MQIKQLYTSKTIMSGIVFTALGIYEVLSGDHTALPMILQSLSGLGIIYGVRDALPTDATKK